jgi:hypothetical protein
MVSLLISLVLLMPTWVNISQSTVTVVSVFPQLTGANLGQSFSIDVTVSNVVDLYAWEIELSWAPSLLGTISVTEGSFLRSGGDTFFIYSWNDTQGHTLIDCTLVGQIVGVNGSGVLATVTFFVLDLGETSLDLHDEVLLDHNEVQITCQVSDGYCYLNVSHDVAIVNVEASPLMALIGDPVNINVTVQDVGAFNETFNVTVYSGSQAIGMEPVSLSSGSSTNLLFTWNTAGYVKGDYAIIASASVVQGEVNIANNYNQTANLLTLLYNGHDIAVTKVEPSKTIVGQGYSAVVKVVVKNYGVFSETSKTAVYANTTTIWSQIDDLTSGSSATLSLVWNTSSFTRGNFTMSADVEPVPDESDIIDNQRISDVPVHIGIPGDISSSIQGTYDGIVNMRDINYLILLFNTNPASPNWKPNADVNNDAVVNMRDIQIAILNFNKHE